MIRRAYKTELSPNESQILQLRQHCGTARYAYNWALSKKIKHYKETGNLLPYREVSKQFNAAKKTEHEWANEVSKMSHQIAIRNLEKAFNNFFRRLKRGETSVFPKFKSKHRDQPRYSVNCERVTIKKEGIRLPKIGWVKLKRKGYIPVSGVKFNSATISYRAGRWFVSVQVEEEISVTENQSGKAVGLDLGLKSFVVDSDGRSIEGPKPLRKSLEKLKRLQRIASRRAKGSGRRRHANDRVARLHYRVSCQRSDFLHKLSRDYVNKNAVIVIEDLSVSGMIRNRRLSQAIGDSGWSEFRRQLDYKCQWYGSQLVVADKFYASSKTCSGCGHKKDKLLLSERTFECDECDFSCDRDQNAALNLVGLVKTEPAEQSANARGEPAMAGSLSREATR